MTSKEFHKEKILPLRLELHELEEQYEKLVRDEHTEKNNGVRASCSNCAHSCVICVDDHDECLYGKCTCCNDWCYGWIPENKVSIFLREHYHYDDYKQLRLNQLFGYNFISKCDDPVKADAVLAMIELVAKYEGKLEV